MSSSVRRLLIATHNAGKVHEIAALLQDSGWSVEALASNVPEFPEDDREPARPRRDQQKNAV